MEDVLNGKRILIVDDEPDVLETLVELLDTCLIDSAPDFDTAKKFLTKNSYDAAILDIMGVRGYDILELAKERNVPALMLTANAVSPDNLVRSIKGGAWCYLPKGHMSEIPLYLADILKQKESGKGKQGDWFERLEPYFDKKFGEGWKDKDKEFWEVFEQKYSASREEMEGML